MYRCLHFTSFCFDVTKIEAKYTNHNTSKKITFTYQTTYQKNKKKTKQKNSEIAFYLSVQKYVFYGNGSENKILNVTLECTIYDEAEGDNLPMINCFTFHIGGTPLHQALHTILLFSGNDNLSFMNKTFYRPNIVSLSEYLF